MPKIWLKNCPLCNPQSVDLRDCEAREGERAQYCQTFLVFRGFTQVSCLKPLTNAQGLCFFRICLKLISSSSVAANKLLLSEKSIKPKILVRLKKIYSKNLIVSYLANEFILHREKYNNQSIYSFIRFQFLF